MSAIDKNTQKQKNDEMNLLNMDELLLKYLTKYIEFSEGNKQVIKTLVKLKE